MKGLTAKQASSLASFLCDFGVSFAKASENVKENSALLAKASKPAHSLTNNDEQLGQTLHIKIGQFIDSTGYNYKKPGATEMATAVSRLHRLDGKPYDEISQLVEYLYGYYAPNSSFDWRMQVRSGLAFRKHYEKIMISANQDYNYRKSRQIEDVK